MHYTTYTDNQGLWRWNLKAANGRIIADSGESYHNYSDCTHGIELVKSSWNSPIK
ncbi:MAG: DUF1508 domain-containing protein [Sphingomonadales bacterium]|nr:DUF1508 domain-containing protein [Sphingomonadales bacterium]